MFFRCFFRCFFDVFSMFFRCFSMFFRCFFDVFSMFFAFFFHLGKNWAFLAKFCEKSLKNRRKIVEKSLKNHRPKLPFFWAGVAKTSRNCREIVKKTSKKHRKNIEKTSKKHRKNIEKTSKKHRVKTRGVSGFRDSVVWRTAQATKASHPWRKGATYHLGPSKQSLLEVGGLGV